ncbi:sensor histidine kinase [Naasia lichenicola]|nr:histidine kinase [Naasia lichenicola]
MVGIGFALAAIAARRWGASKSMPWLLVFAALTWTFGTMSDGLGRESGWWVPLAGFQMGYVVVVVVTVVGYPTGRVTSWPGRIAVAAAAFLYLSNIVVHLFFVDPAADRACLCAENPLALVSDVDLNYRVAWWPAQWHGLVAIVLLVTVAVRWIRGTQPWKSINLLMTVAVLGLAIAWLYLAITEFIGGSRPSPVLFYLVTLSHLAIAVIYAAGLFQLTQTRARVADVMIAARDGIDRTTWDRLTRQALDDRSAQVLWRSGSRGLVDADGAVTPRPASAFAVTSDREEVALIAHDPATAAKRDLLASLAESIRLTSENDRLAGELERSLAQVRESRQRLVGAADDTRRRIERDLHDGAQQLLLTAALSVENASRRAASSDDPELARMLATATEQLVLARRELRELARGITPAVLNHGGLDAALEELALRCPVPTSVTVVGDGRPSELAETTVYFSVAEGLTNIAKHSGATSASVEVQLGHPLHLTITDDGIGGATAAAGGGLAGLADRIEAVGGELTVWSPVGRGTIIRASVPSLEHEPA